MDSSSGKSMKVCVTGGSGFIASWIIKLLLERGYTVNATVRSLNDPTKTEHLYALDGAKERLHLYEAKLLEEGSFDAAIHGCDGVFHTASPVIMGETPNPQVDLIDPAVKGTLNVLTSCKKAPSVKKVILTSSISAVMFNGTPLTEETIVDETWFSSPQVCQEMKQWYLVSKTLAEEAAWKFAGDNGIEMVSINPSVVIGPFLQPTPNTSVAAILILINGSSDVYLNATLGWVHVKDVAEAHIRAFELASTSGRYILNESVAHVSEIVKLLTELYPTLKLPHKSSDDQPFPPIFKVSNDKVKSLGIEYIPLKAALKETVECFKEKKFVTI